VLAVATFLGVDIGLSFVKRAFSTADRVLDNVPVLLIEKGEILHDRLKKERVDAEDILAQARERHGIGRMDEIDYAVLEISGNISIIPKRRPATS
jgi:uncharacterized membrane protein YcaP (DUF421 family)